ncbi:MAG: glutaredoxin family protein [Halofilum sp. (in: g-proteobacteria)]
MAGGLVLYTRAGCHLCHDMLAAARPIAQEHGLEIVLVDIDDDLKLAARYNLNIPVLELDGHEVCHHFLDQAALERALAER